jgi:hypothetical protein
MALPRANSRPTPPRGPTARTAAWRRRRLGTRLVWRTRWLVRFAPASSAQWFAMSLPLPVDRYEASMLARTTVFNAWLHGDSAFESDPALLVRVAQSVARDEAPWREWLALDGRCVLEAFQVERGVLPWSTTGAVGSESWTAEDLLAGRVRSDLLTELRSHAAVERFTRQDVEVAGLDVGVRGGELRCGVAAPLAASAVASALRRARTIRRCAPLEPRAPSRAPTIPGRHRFAEAFLDRKSTRLNSSHNPASRMPSSA